MTDLSPAAVLLEHAEFVRRLATQLAGAADGEDVAQEAWAKVLARPGRAVHEPAGWLRRVVTNVWRNRTRGERRHRAHAAAAGAASAAAGAGAPGPDEIAAREEVRSHVVAAVLALPAPLRDVVVLSFHEGLASPEIAARLGLSPSGVRTRMQQAMERLREQLDSRYGGSRAAWAAPLLTWRRHATAAATASSPFAIATWWRSAALVAVVATAAVWFVASDAAPPVNTITTAATPSRHDAEPAGAAADAPPQDAVDTRVAVAGEAPPATPLVYRGEAPAGGLRGVVRGGVDGRLLPDVVVRLHAIEPTSSAIAPFELHVRERRETRADANAEFTFAALPACAYEIEAEHTDGRRAWRRVAVGGGEQHVELWLHTAPFGGNATVKVLDSSRQPVAGADVTLVLHCERHGAIGWNGAPAIRGATDAAGVFRLDDVHRLDSVFEGLVFAQTADGRAGTTVIARPEHRSDYSYWEVVVDRPGSLAVTIPGAGSDASAALRAFAEPLACYHHVLRDGPRFALERGDGGVLTANVPAGSYHVRVEAAGSRRQLDKRIENWQMLPSLTVKAGERTDATIPLTAAAIVRGRVLDHRGEPLANADVRALRPRPGLFVHPGRSPRPEDVYGGGAARTDAAGEYELSLDPGTWDVAAIAAGRTLDLRRDVVAAAGDGAAALEHSLEPDGALHGMTHLSLLALRAAAAPEFVHGIVVRDGAFAVRGLAPGTWEAGRYADDRFIAITPFTITAGACTWLALDAHSASVMRGVVQHDGVGVPGLDVTVGDDHSARATTGDDGSFVLPLRGAAPALRIAHRGVLVQRVPLPQHADRSELGVVALRARRVSVQANGPDGQPEAATLWAWNNDDMGAPRRHFAADGRLDAQWMPAASAATSFVGVRFTDGSEQTVQLDASARDVVVTRRPGGTLELRVIDPEGCPRPAATFRVLAWGRNGEAPRDGAAFVTARDRDAPSTFAVTDRSGRATVHGVTPGPVLVYFSGEWGDFAPGGDGQRRPSPLEQVVDVPAGGTRVVDLVLPRF